jgi:acyl-coenzyme A synthetase/AMP-(fatty) acid ligase
MVYHPRKDHDFPNIDLLTLIFDHPEAGSTDSTISHAEAEDPSNCLNRAEVRRYTKRIAHGLRTQYGVGESGPGKDVVLVISSGQILLPCLFYGVIAAGGVYSAASSSFTAAELARQVKQGEANLICCSRDVEDVAREAAKECGLPIDRVLVLESDGGKRILKSLDTGRSAIAEQELDWTRITDKAELKQSLICLLYSSGTTGVPKGKSEDPCFG